MKTIYAIRDRVAQELTGLQMYALMLFRTPEQAARYFSDAVNDPTSILNKHPADYELIVCGTISDNGVIQAFPEPQLVVTGDTLLALQKPELVKDNA